MLPNATKPQPVPYTGTQFPDFEGRRVFVTPGAFVGSIRSMLLQAGFQPAPSHLEADVVCFSGGADINPELYGEVPHRTTYWSDDRDAYERRVYDHCVEHGKFMYGICRGMQVLHCFNGGKLWQNVQGHGSSHLITDIEDNVTVLATSIHHQMLKPNDNLQVVAVATNQVSHLFEDGLTTTTIGKLDRRIEIEAGYYKDTGCFFVQGHPEVGSAEYQSWSLRKLYSVMSDWEAVNNYVADVA